MMITRPPIPTEREKHGTALLWTAIAAAAPSCAQCHPHSCLECSHRCEGDVNTFIIISSFSSSHHHRQASSFWLINIKPIKKKHDSLKSSAKYLRKCIQYWIFISIFTMCTLSQSHNTATRAERRNEPCCCSASVAPQRHKSSMPWKFGLPAP